jgi:hypothetical protein
VFVNGDIDDGSTDASREVTDKTGRFAFPSQDKPFQVVITHDSGYAMIESAADWELMRIIHLEPWAKVEGTFRVGKEAVAGVPIEIHYSGRSVKAQDGVKFFPRASTTTGAGGRFVFDRVIPGRGSMGRSILITVNDGATEATSSRHDMVDFPAGKTVSVELGGTGRPVVGRLEAPPEFAGNVRWSFATITLYYPNEVRRHGTSFSITADKEGKFRIDDVPAGEYWMSVWFADRQPLTIPGFPVNVPAMTGGRSDDPLDLGAVKLQRIGGDFGNGGR